ncbi:hypothetical protein [uncultured Rhodoferax sp.]|uniref:hypothetical protein n=1 Tax=uncultured Rhodoferax sp. TaxID=223188 RepID=UPI0025F624E1|nr:hypothetical protein [uncultured Rhodoferax sp.]
MKTALIAAVALALTGCGLLPVSRTTTAVPVAVECREKVADRPAMPTEAFTAKPSLDVWVKAQDAEIVIREGYEKELRTALEACTAPVAR